MIVALLIDTVQLDDDLSAISTQLGVVSFHRSTMDTGKHQKNMVNRSIDCKMRYDEGWPELNPRLGLADPWESSDRQARWYIARRKILRAKPVKVVLFSGPGPDISEVRHRITARVGGHLSLGRSSTPLTRFDPASAGVIRRDRSQIKNGQRWFLCESEHECENGRLCRCIRNFTRLPSM